MPGREAYEARGLLDPVRHDADERLELLDYLVSLGATLDEIAFADEHLHVTWVPALLALRPGGTTLRQLSARAEMPEADVRDTWRALGLTPPGEREPAFADSDASIFCTLAALERAIGTDLAVQLLHALGAACGQIADAQVGAVVQAVARTDIDTGSTDLERARFNARTVELLHETNRHIDTLLEHHVRHAMTRWQMARAGLPDDRVRLAIGFVDLVGYTTLAHEISIADLGRLVNHLETVAIAAAADRHGRIVKLVGDAVMFVSVDSASACEIALELLSTFDSATAGTTPRGGIASGEVVGREGDYYGPAVNLAARIAQEAAAGDILVTESVRDDVLASRAHLEFEGAGRRSLRGFSEPVHLYEVTRPKR